MSAREPSPGSNIPSIWLRKFFNTNRKGYLDHISSLISTWSSASLDMSGNQTSRVCVLMWTGGDLRQTFFFFLIQSHKCLPFSDISSFRQNVCVSVDHFLLTDGSVTGTSSWTERSLVPPFLFLCVLTCSHVSGNTKSDSWNLQVLMCAKGTYDPAKGLINSNQRKREINNGVKRDL